MWWPSGTAAGLGCTRLMSPGFDIILVLQCDRLHHIFLTCRYKSPERGQPSPSLLGHYSGCHGCTAVGHAGSRTTGTALLSLWLPSLSAQAPAADWDSLGTAWSVAKSRFWPRSQDPPCCLTGGGEPEGQKQIQLFQCYRWWHQGTDVSFLPGTAQETRDGAVHATVASSACGFSSESPYWSHSQHTCNRNCTARSVSVPSSILLRGTRSPLHQICFLGWPGKQKPLSSVECWSLSSGRLGSVPGLP